MQKLLPETEVRWLLILLVLTCCLLIAGLIMPVMTITSLVFFSDSFSVLLGVYQLWQEGHVFLFLLVGIFSIILPFVKLAILLHILTTRQAALVSTKKLLHLMHDYGRWAMLDVMVVAVLIVTVKLGAIASVEVHSGLYMFGLAVLLIMFITHRVVRLTQPYK
jgi:paraquat-inducible protein A